MTMHKIKNANIELNKYEVICTVNDETLEDFISVVKEEINKWGELEITVPIKNYLCLLK